MSSEVLDLGGRVVRELTEEDVKRPSVGVPTTRRMGHGHHVIAQLMAKGTRAVEISAITGYSQSYLSVLKTDGGFRDLVEHYSNEREALFVDVLERMKLLEITTLEEIQQRLTDDPSGWTKRELMDLAQMLGRGRGEVKGGSGGSGVNVVVNFVEGSPAIDITPMERTNDN